MHVNAGTETDDDRIETDDAGAETDDGDGIDAVPPTGPRAGPGSHVRGGDD